MAKRGDIARQAVYDKIAAAFGADFLGINDKKLYVQTKEGAENIAFSIAITMPKVVPEFFVASSETTNTSAPAWETQNAIPAKPKATLSEEDKDKIDDLMRKLGLV